MRLRPLARRSVSLSLGQQVPLKNGEPVRGELGRSAMSLDEKRPPTEAAIRGDTKKPSFQPQSQTLPVKIDTAPSSPRDRLWSVTNGVTIPINFETPEGWNRATGWFASLHIPVSYSLVGREPVNQAKIEDYNLPLSARIPRPRERGCSVSEIAVESIRAIAKEV